MNNNKIHLDIKIIKEKHRLNVFKETHPLTYVNKIEYREILNGLEELLKIQKDIDRKNFNINLLSIYEFRTKVLKRKENKAMYLKLSEIEKNFIDSSGYNYLDDPEHLLSNNVDCYSQIGLKWKEIKIDKYNKYSNEQV